MNNHKWGLVLSGGGGKGAYQLGVYRALCETELFSCINGISGASIGAINAALFAMNNYDNALKAWSEVKPELFLTPQALLYNKSTQIKKIFSDLYDTDSNFYKDIADYVSKNGIFSRQGLEMLLQKYIDYNKLSKCHYAIYANAVSGGVPGKEVRYFSLNDKNPETIKNIILASSALPYIYEPVMIDNTLYYDGGLLDNIPVKPLVELGMKHIIVVRLDSKSHIPLSYANMADYIDIAPSRSIGNFINGTMDFNEKNVKIRIELGYRDALRKIRHYKLKKAGTPISLTDALAEEEIDYMAITSLIKKDVHQTNINPHIYALSNILNKYNI